MKIFNYLTLLLIILLVISSCKEDDNENLKPIDNPGDTTVLSDVADERKQEIFEKVTSSMNELTWEDREADYQKIETYLKSCPEFKEVGYSEEGANVYGIFNDGTLYIVANNRTKADEFVDMDTGRKSESGQKVSQFRDNNLPGSGIAHLFNALGTSFSSSRYSQRNIERLFMDKGYQVSLMDGTIDNLKKLKNPGVFYFATHGGFVPTSQDSIFGAWTSDAANDANDKKYKQDLKERRLIHFTALHNVGPDGRDQAATHYAITAKFVEKYMTLSTTALMYIDACLSFKDEDFKSAFLKQTANTGAYLGWTDLVGDQDSYNNAAFFFDRMLGANFPYQNYYPESPAQRPFDLPSVMADMTNKGLRKSITQGKTATLEFRAADSEDFILRPSIAYLQMDELNDMLYIYGLFGKDVGEEFRFVTVDGDPVNVSYWSPTLIQCKINNSGKGSAGDVIVKNWLVESNPRQLSQWRGTLKYKRPSEGSIMEEFTFNVHLRGDVGKYREAPGKTPVTVPQPAGLKFPANDSKGTFSMGGSGGHNYTAVCSYKNSVTWTDNNGELPLLDMMGGHMPGDTHLTLTVKPLSTGFVLENLGVSVATQSTAYMKSFWDCGEGEGENPIGPQSVYFGVVPQKFKTLDLIFDSNFNIKSGRITDEQEGRAGLPYGGAAFGDPVQTFQISLDWSFDAVKFPPKATDPK